MRSCLRLKLAASAVLAAAAIANAQDDFATRFLSPPPQARILKIIHSWPDEPAAQDKLIRSLCDQGFGGVVCNVSFQDYLRSETKWDAFCRALEQARKEGFALWLYDEKGYPSGTAGGLVLRGHPEWEARGLLIADTEAQSTGATLELPPGTPTLVAAYPVNDHGLDLAGRTNLLALVKGGKVSWQPPPGRWHIVAITLENLYEGTHASLSLSDHIPYPNLLNPEPTAKFLELTHDAYSKHLGTNLSRYFVATFTDEPSLMSLFLRPMPYRVLPWSTELPLVFRQKHGYGLEDKLPALLTEAGAETSRVRYDYWSTVAEMVSANFFGQIQRWCAKHQVLSGGHLLMEENLVSQVPLYGDFFACLRRLDAPGIDCLTSIPEQVPWFIARLAGSAAELEGRNVTMCETSDHSQRYRPPGDSRQVTKVSEHEIRGTCNRLMVSGIDTITSYYSFDGLETAQLRQLNDYVGRCCFSLKGGHQVADVAVLYPVESVWTSFTPARHYANSSPRASAIENIFRDVSESLFHGGRDFAYVDSRALAEARVDRGALVHGALRWRVVILPGADTLPLKAWSNLASFVASGGIVISVGALPKNSEKAFPDTKVEQLGSELFKAGNQAPSVVANAAGGAGIYLPAGLASVVPEILVRTLAFDCQASQEHSPLRYTHRRIADHDVYFIVNDSKQPWQGRVKLCADGEGEQCDPATGVCIPVSSGRDLELGLEGYGSRIFRFARCDLPARFELSGAILPAFSMRNLPTVDPLLARGEFVRAELKRTHPERSDANQSTNQPAFAWWEADASLTKSDVDTFLFLRFAYKQPLSLRGARAIVLDSRVPEGQLAPAQLLLMLHEKGGADYLAHTGRLLNSPGEEQSWVALDRFQLAGWSNDANGQLDLDDITEIRVGWGGYFGKQNEKVAFSVAAPRLAQGAASQQRASNQEGQFRSRVDLRPEFDRLGLSVRLQGDRPTCSVFTLAGSLEFATARARGRASRLSVEYLNWAANRVCREAQDGGFFSDLWTGFTKYGICSEPLMPYQSKFDPQQAPGTEASADARTALELGLKLHWIKKWNVKTGLAESEFTGIIRTLEQGWPVCGGYRWPVEERWVDGVLQMCPATAVRDGHSILLVGFRPDRTQPGGGVFIFRNSGGRGRDGYMPYAYAREYMNDAVWIECPSPPKGGQ